MALKQASLLAFIGTLLLSILLIVDLVLDLLSLARGLIRRGDAAHILDPHLRCRERGDILLSCITERSRKSPCPKSL